MAKVLYVQASPRVERSYSIAAAGAFVQAYRSSNPNDEIVTINLFDKNLPPFDGLAVQAKYTILHGIEHSEEELEAWKSVEAVIEEFKSADKYVFAVPMWNFSIPYRLKQYIDILVQPGYTFSYSQEEGYRGLVTGKPAAVFYSRGGVYSPGSGAEAYDHQTPYFEMMLKFIGFTDVRTCIVEPTLQGGPDTAKEKRAEAVEKAEEMAGSF